MRINKLLSSLGYCSRREANRWIEAGRLTVNGKPCQLGQWLETEGAVLLDEVRLDGQPLVQQPPIYLLLNKPVGITCTAEPEVAGNIIEFLNYPSYVFPVGRLDKDSQGLMLLTNDGALAHQLLFSEHEHEKTYEVMVQKPITPAFLDQMAAGVLVDGVMTRPCRLKTLSDHEFEIILSQGLNRQIRKMCSAFGYKVIQLKRTHILNLSLGNLPLGQWRPVSSEELDELRSLLYPLDSLNQSEEDFNPNDSEK